MRFKEPTTRVIFVRHGKTDFPKDRIYCDDIEDPPLNETGLAQARAAADHLQHVPLTAIYASPACRTWRTAEAIAELRGMPIQACPAARERRFGVWDGLWFKEIEQRYPDEYQRWKQDPTGFSPEGGETLYGLLARSRPALLDIVARHGGETIALVAHVGTIRALVADAIGLPLERHRQLTIDYASATCIDFGKSQNNLMYFNLSGAVAA